MSFMVAAFPQICGTINETFSSVHVRVVCAKIPAVRVALCESVQRCSCRFRSPTFHNFIKVALTKNPKKRPNADRLLEVNICSTDRA